IRPLPSVGRPRARARDPHRRRRARHARVARRRRHRRRLRSGARAGGGLAQDGGGSLGPRCRRARPRVLVWLNGPLVPARPARVSAFVRGLLHGDGLYETCRTYVGCPFLVAAHLRRMAAAAKRLHLPPPGSPARWERLTRRLVARNRLPDAAVRLTITRGAA